MNDKKWVESSHWHCGVDRFNSPLALPGWRLAHPYPPVSPGLVESWADHLRKFWK